MIEVIKHVIKQPYWVLTLLAGISLVAFPCVTIDKDNHLLSHPPTTLYPVAVGIALVIVSISGYVVSLLKAPLETGNVTGGIDLARVRKEKDGFSTTVGRCKIRVVEGRIEDQVHDADVAIALPCNEYFDDRCVDDSRSALGAYVRQVFEGQGQEFIALMKEECVKRLGIGTEQQKTDDERAASFGVGRCVCLIRPLNRSSPVALISTTTQRARQGLSARISYLFEGMQELVTRLADARINKVVMPVLGAGHGGIAAPLAFVGLVLAVAEAAVYNPGGLGLKQVTIVVFKKDLGSAAEVDKTIVRRALALVGDRQDESCSS
jgi:hypothetical protein